jgi:hypothetical protein
MNIGPDELIVPTDVSEHKAQRGDGHEVLTVREPIFTDGGPTFAIGTRVVVDLDLRHGLEGTVIGTLTDFDGKEWVGFINDLNNPHLAPAANSMQVKGRGIHRELFDPHHDRHYWIERDEPGWVARIKEFPMMWYASTLSQEDSIKGLINMIDEAIEYQEHHPGDLGHFRP